VRPAREQPAAGRRLAPEPSGPASDGTLRQFCASRAIPPTTRSTAPSG
jgi:hypothetical protein